MKKAIVIYDKGCFELTGFELNEEKNSVSMYSYGEVVSSIVSTEGNNFDYWKKILTDAIVNGKTIELKEFL